MYDFYKNPPTNKSELRDWLTSWLKKPDPEPPLLEYNNETFVQELGFRRAFHNHTVLRNIRTNEYVWWVFPSEDTLNLDTFPATRFPSYEIMLEEVIDNYYVDWKLGNTRSKSNL